MPSPFPGMDPFLEHPDIFPDLHDRLNAYLSEALQAQLPPPYYAALGRRAWIEMSQRYIGPDINVLQSRRDEPRREGNGNGGVAVATPVATRVRIVHVPHDERVEPSVEIFVGQGRDKRLVTTIEILSWTNKAPGEHGRDLYLRKQREVLGSKVHLVEIDLLRGGEHTTAVPKDRASQHAGPFDYHVCIHHFDNLEDYFVYPIQLAERLPEIAVPLLPNDGAVTLDLQQVFDRAYDAGPYRREVRYADEPLVPPVTPEQADWVRSRLANTQESSGR